MLVSNLAIQCRARALTQFTRNTGAHQKTVRMVDNVGGLPKFKSRRRIDMKVLVVEDEAIIAHHLMAIAADAGFATLGPASTMEQALAYAPRADIALIDVGLSDGKSGIQLARRLIDRYYTTIIFVTGAPEALKHGFAGAFAAIAKPFPDEDVADVLRRASHMRIAGSPGATG